MKIIAKRLLSKLASLTPMGRILSTHRIETGKAAGFDLVAPGNSDPQFFHGDYEMPMQEAIAEMLSPDDVFYDIGANLGFFSLVAARSVGPTGQVYAFEPVPRNAAAIRRSVELNALDTVEVFFQAVGAETGKADLWLTRHIGGAALASEDAPPDRFKKIEVDVVTIDDVIARSGLKEPTLIKIDVEGGELAVLKGLEQTLHRVRPEILCEIDDASAEGLETKRRDVFDFLARFGYQFQTLPSAYEGSDWHVMHIKATQG